MCLKLLEKYIKVYICTILKFIIKLNFKNIIIVNLQACIFIPILFTLTILQIMNVFTAKMNGLRNNIKNNFKKYINIHNKNIIIKKNTASI